MTAPPVTVRKAVVVGAGSAGRRHMRNLRRLVPDIRITCWRMSETPADAELASCADEVVFDEAGAVAAEPDIAIAAGPATTREPTIRPFVTRGVPMLVEKPFAADVDTARRLRALCREQPAPMLVGYTLRFHPLLMRLRDELRSGRIGNPIGMRVSVGQYLPHWRPGTDWRRSVTARRELGGGVLLDLSHELDYLRWCLGEATTVMALVRPAPELGIDVDAYAEVVLEFESGAIGSAHLDLIQQPMTRECQVIGERGSLALDFVGGSLRATAAAGGWQELMSVPDLDRNTLFLDELSHFLACARGDDAPRITADDGCRGVEIVEAARTASQQRTAVRV